MEKELLVFSEGAPNSVIFMILIRGLHIFKVKLLEAGAGILLVSLRPQDPAHMSIALDAVWSLRLTNFLNGYQLLGFFSPHHLTFL